MASLLSPQSAPPHGDNSLTVTSPPSINVSSSSIEPTTMPMPIRSLSSSTTASSTPSSRKRNGGSADGKNPIMLVALRRESSSNMVRLATESTASTTNLQAMLFRSGYRCVSFASLEDAFRKTSPIPPIVFPSHSPTHAVAALLTTSASSSPSGSPQQFHRHYQQREQQQVQGKTQATNSINLSQLYMCVMLDGIRSTEHIQFVDELRQAQPQLLIFGSTNGSKLQESDCLRYAKVGMDAIFESGCRLQDEFAKVLEEARFFGPGTQCIYVSSDGTKTRIEKNPTPPSITTNNNGSSSQLSASDAQRT